MVRKIMLLLWVLMIGGAFWLGYWPQHQLVGAIQQENDAIKKELTPAQSLGRVARLENELLLLIEQTESQNYGEAQKLSNSFFDDLRKEIDINKTAPYNPKLEAILARRDAVTAGLARGEATTVAQLRQSLSEMRELVLALSR